MAHELMTDDEFCQAIEQLGEAGNHDLSELIKAMNESRIISWEEAERILQDTCEGPVKSSLPEQTRPSEPENDTDVEQCIRRLNDNDPTLKEVNLNNMKRTPVPQIRRLLEALAYNEFCERISLANMGLYDNDVAVLPSVLELNQTLKRLNLETNYLSGDYFSRLFKAACVNMSLEEIKAVNQGVSFATSAEKEIIEAIVSNKGLTKVSVNLRLPEGRHKIEHATLRNGEIKRVLRREAALKAKQEAEELAKNPVPKLAKELPKKIAEPPKTASPPKPRGSQLANPTIASSAKEKIPDPERRSSTTKSSTPVIPMVKAVEKPPPPLQKGSSTIKKITDSNGNIDNESQKVEKPIVPKKPNHEVHDDGKPSWAKRFGAEVTLRKAATNEPKKPLVATAAKPELQKQPSTDSTPASSDDSKTEKALTSQTEVAKSIAEPEKKPAPTVTTIRKTFVKPKNPALLKDAPGKATPESELSAESGSATPVKKVSANSQPSTIIKDTLKKLAETGEAQLKTSDGLPLDDMSSKKDPDNPDKPAPKKKRIVRRVVKVRKKKPVTDDADSTSQVPKTESSTEAVTKA
ncbi:unnamed protein product [Auanema sp. JU1783]|nr:unnamed protein product [Auanema sp. JU1783]